MILLISCAGTLELARVRRGGVEHPADNCVVGRTAGQAGQFDIAKAVVGEVRFERRFAAAPSIVVDLLRRCGDWLV